MRDYQFCARNLPKMATLCPAKIADFACHLRKIFMQLIDLIMMKIGL